MANLLQFKQISKDSYFYNKYRYCLGFALDEVNALKSLDHDYIDTIIERRQIWREVAQQRWSHGRQKITGTLFSQTIMTKRYKEITQETVENLHNLTDILLKTSADFKLVTSVNQGWIYTNGISLVKKLNSLSYLENKNYSEAVITRPKGTIKLNNPKYTHRSYIKNLKLSNHQKQNLINFFANQTDGITQSSSFNTWLTETPFLRTQDYFFIDHVGESWLVMLNLIHPGIIRKTLKIIPT